MEAESERRLSEFLEAKVLSDHLKHSESLLKNRRKELVRRGLERLEVDPIVDVDLISEVVVPSLDLPELIWDPETERAFAYLVGLDVSGGTPLPTKGTS